MTTRTITASTALLLALTLLISGVAPAGAESREDTNRCPAGWRELPLPAGRTVCIPDVGVEWPPGPPGPPEGPDDTDDDTESDDDTEVPSPTPTPTPPPPPPAEPAQPGWDDVDPGDSTPTPAPTTPRFAIEAIRFTASDESGWDRWGSDEVVFVFTSVTGSETHTVRTREFGGVDTGESRSLRSLCVLADCTDGFTEPTKLSIQLFEMDWGDPDDVETAVKAAVAAVEWGSLIVTGNKVDVPDWLPKSLIDLAGNDLMGSLTLEFDPAELARRLPVGASTTQRHHLGGNSGDLPFEIAGGPDYHLELRITRLENVAAPGGLSTTLPGTAITPGVPGIGGVSTR